MDCGGVLRWRNREERYGAAGMHESQATVNGPAVASEQGSDLVECVDGLEHTHALVCEIPEP